MTEVKTTLQKILNKETVAGITEDEANAVRNILNVGAPKTEVKLILTASLQEDWKDDQSALKAQMASNETAQIWNLTVQMSVTNKNGNDEAIDNPENIAVSETATGIQFQLSTGQNLSGKVVRVLYLHQDAVGIATSSVTDAANGVVNVTASKFSPYVILSKVRTSSGGHTSSNTYSVIVKDATNGKLTADRVTAAKDATVTITVSPDKGYEVDEIIVKDANGKEIKLTDKGNGKYTFTMPASKVTVSASFSKVSGLFPDVPDDAYYADAVDWAVKKGITGGISATTFNPNGICTRAQAVTFLWRAAGSPEPNSTEMPFVDVSADSYYYKAVLWAVENGITKGTTDTTFSPDMVCNRGHIVTFLWRAQKSPTSGSVNPFTDVPANAYYTSAVLWAVAENITKGTTDTTFSPAQGCTRAQIVTFIYRQFNP